MNQVIYQKLGEVEQGHLQEKLGTMSADQEAFFQTQVERLSAFLSTSHCTPEPPSSSDITPFKDFESEADSETKEIGHRLIAEGKLGCILVAGGQGSRLRFDGPKGMYPFSKHKKKSLFQHFSELSRAASKQAGRPLQLAIMTSPLNHEQTVRHFKENAFFGLEESQVHFFEQSVLPFLDDSGKAYLENPVKIAEGPDGNGGVLHSFAEAGLMQKWKDAGIEYINFILVDNPLADPFDASLLAQHVKGQNDVTVKCIDREDPSEKVGVLVSRGEAAQIVEYNELSEEAKQLRNSDGSLSHRCASIGLFCFSMDFVSRVASAPVEKFPLHKSKKAIRHLDENGETVLSSKPIAWKYERYIFDTFTEAKKIGAVLFAREDVFAPLKEAKGPNGLESVQEALFRKECRQYKKLTGKEAPAKPFELSPEFFYPTPEFLEMCKREVELEELT